MPALINTRMSRVFAVFLIVFALAACAKSNPGVTSEGAGFFLGLFQGFIVLFALIGKWFGVAAIYEVYNDGGWYDTGFVIGVALFFGSAGSQSSGSSTPQ